MKIPEITVEIPAILLFIGSMFIGYKFTETVFSNFYFLGSVLVGILCYAITKLVLVRWPTIHDTKLKERQLAAYFCFSIACLVTWWRVINSVQIGQIGVLLCTLILIAPWLVFYSLTSPMFQIIRFFLSSLIFERILKWQPASEIVPGVDSKVDSYNRTHGKQKCYKCGHDSMVNDNEGGHGIFSYPHYFYRCPKCGNAQESNGSRRLSLSDELKEKRIVSEGRYPDTRYRYRILTEGQWIVTFIIGFILFLANLYSWINT